MDRKYPSDGPLIQQKRNNPQKIKGKPPIITAPILIRASPIDGAHFKGKFPFVTIAKVF